jgi:hypothetical protein
MAQVVVGPEPKQPGFAHAQTLMGGVQVMEEAEAIIAQREQQMRDQQMRDQQMQPTQMPMPQAHEQQMMGFPSQPQLPPHSPQGLSPHEPFPSPGFYGSDSAIEPQQKPGLGPLLLGAGVGLLTVTVVVGGYYGYRALTAPSAAPSSSAAAASAAPPPAGGSAAPAPATAQTGAAGTAKPTASAAPALPPANAGSVDAEARAALEKLSAGIKSCVATTIGKLPGTAPAVPSSLTWLKSGSYKPSLNDFESPVYHCAKFKIEQPMRFVIQWQSEDLKGTKGSAIAWIDDNGDGTADRAFGFSATLPKRKVAEIGPIEAVDAKRAIKKR